MDALFFTSIRDKRVKKLCACYEFMEFSLFNS
jgi:hypothetical protein